MLSHLANKLPEESRIWVYDVVEQMVDDACAEFPGRVLKAKSAKDVAQQVVSLNAILLVPLLMPWQDTIVSMVPEGAHVRSVYLDPQTGVCSTDISNKLLVDCSTIDTATSLAV